MILLLLKPMNVRVGETVFSTDFSQMPYSDYSAVTITNVTFYDQDGKILIRKELDRPVMKINTSFRVRTDYWDML